MPHVCTKEVVIDVDQTINFVPLSKKKKEKTEKTEKKTKMDQAKKPVSLVCFSQETGDEEKLDMFITDIVIFSLKKKEREINKGKNKIVEFFQERRRNENDSS